MAVDTSDDGARLIARGALIRLEDGEHRIRFTYEALELIEEEFDGLDEFIGALRETRMKAKRLKSIRLGITAGLLHEKSAGISLEAFKAMVLSNLNSLQLVDYLDALTVAIMEAFPAPTEETETPKAMGGTASPGNGSTTLRRSDSGARTRRSGV